MRRIACFLTICFVLAGCNQPLWSKAKPPDPLARERESIARAERLRPPPDKFNVKGFYLGMKLPTARELSSLKCLASSSDSLCIDRYCSAPDQNTIAGVAAKDFELYMFRGAVQMIQVTFAPSSFTTVTQSFISKYGAPSESSTEDVHNAFGAKFTKQTMKWKIQDAVVTITNLDRKITRGGLWVEPQIPSAVVADCRKKSSEKAKNDL